MDLAALQIVARELNNELSSGFVNKIHQPLTREVVLRARMRGTGEKKLMLSADPQLGRIHLTDFRIPNPAAPPRFCAFLRAHFQGSIITGITCEPDDRVVKIATVRGRVPDVTLRVLVLELLGRDSNILLLDGSTGVIMDCLHRIPQKETTTRIVFPGAVYELPPKRSSPPGAAPLPTPVNPGITTRPNGKRKLTVSATADDEEFPSMNDAVNAFFRPMIEGLLLEGLRREIARPVKASIRAIARRAEKVRADIQRLDNLAACGEEGELLKANLARVRKGLTEFDARDWTSGEMRRVPLDPALGPVANMERKFRAAAKGKRGRSIAEERLRQTLEEKAYFEELLFYIDTAQGADELEQLSREVPAERRAKRSAPQSRMDEKSTAVFYHSYDGPGGFAILVGKSGKGNDRLLRTRAHEGDLWFHVKDTPGAHVLLLQREGKIADESDRAFAAGLAIHFSRAKGKGKAEVIVTDVRNVDRPKGASPGQVTVRAHHTVVAEEIDPQTFFGE